MELGAPQAEMRQPDFSVTDDGRGLLEASVRSYHKTNTNSPRIPTSVPKKGEKHPTITELVCYKSSFTFQRNNIGYCQADYVGLKKDPTEGDWEISSSSSDQSLIFHPNFKDWAVKTAGDAQATPAKPTVWQPWVVTTDDKPPQFKTFKDTTKFDKVHNFQGIESYIVPSIIVRVTFHTAKFNIVGTIIAGLGKTRSSPYQAPESLKVSDGRNWLLTSASANQYGTIYRVQTEWTLSSGKSPHNKYVYPEFSL
jgi:hypothetical protein